MLIAPIGTERRLRGFPWVTLGLMAVNVFVFFVLQGHPESADFALVYGRFSWWMPVTYMFAHGGIVHLAGNMLFLWVFGPHAEDALGRGRFAQLYFTAGLASAGLHVLASMILYPEDLAVGLVGASGAIMGIVALFVLRYHGVRVRFFLWLIIPYIIHVRALWVGIGFFGWDLISALTMVGSEGGAGGVAHWAHIGGFLIGAAWAWALRLPAEGSHEVKHDAARDLIAAGNHREAARELEKRIEERPGDAQLHAEAASCYEMLRGENESAARHWSEHIRLLLLHDDYSGAVERFRKLTERFRPGDFGPAVLLRVGVAAENLDENDTALPALMAVAEAHPESPQAPVAALRAARLFRAHEQPGRERSVLEMTQQRWPDSEAALTAARRLGELRGG